MQVKLIKAKNGCRKLSEENSSDRKKPPRPFIKLVWEALPGAASVHGTRCGILSGPTVMFLAMYLN